MIKIELNILKIIWLIKNNIIIIKNMFKLKYNLNINIIQ